MAFFVYVLLSPEGKTYIGQTADLERHLPSTMTPIAV